MPCVFTFVDNNNTNAHVLTYVDDLCIMAKDIGLITKVKKILKGLYEVKDLGEARYILGVGIRRSEDCSIHLTQK
jgi:hypothetical protein